MKTRFVAVCASVALAASAGAVSSPWVYLPEESVISNNNAVGRSTDWVLNVSVVDSANHTLAIGKGTAGDAYVEREGVVVGGATLDLSETVSDSDGNSWKIVQFNYRCFKKDGAPICTFVAPRTLKSIDQKQFDYGNRIGAIDFTFDCPDLTYIPNGLLGGNMDNNLKLVAPKCTGIDNWGLSQLGSVDVSSWNLSGLESVGAQAFVRGRIKGTFKLPRLKVLGNNSFPTYAVFSNAELTRLELGNRNNSLQVVYANAFSGNTCAELVIGGATGFTIGANAFASTDLSRVWMTGSVPTFEEDGLAFGTANHAEKSMVFYVPDTAAWTAVRAGATALTEEEVATFKAAHPDWEVPFGVVAADVFHTQNAQYIGTADLGALGVMCRVSVGNRSEGQYGDALMVTTNGVIVTDGEVPYGTTVTVTATPAKDSTIVSWEGTLLDGTTPTGRSVTFEVTENVSFFARFTHAWEFDAEAVPQTITDGYWTLVVTNTYERNLVLGICPYWVNGQQVNPRAEMDGRTQVPWAFLKDTESSLKGELDLSGPVYTKGTSVSIEDSRWTITELCDKAFGSMANITSFYAPSSGFRKWGSQVFNNAGGVTNVVLNCPNVTTDALFPWAYDFSYCPIERLVLNLPNLTKVGYNDSAQASNFGSATFTDSDLTEWDLSGLTFVSQYGLRAGAWNGVGPKGDLVLPNIETLCDGAFHNWRRISSAALGTNGTLKTLGAYLFANNTDTLKKLDFGTSSVFTVSNTTFLAAEDTPLPVEEVWFAGKAPSVEALDNILALRTVAEDGTKPVKIFAPMMDATWKAVCRSFTDEEATVARTMRKEQNLRVIGVYETQDGRRAAWLVQNPAFPYRSGFVITIR